ncbi:L-glutamate gamma-semialdehyde dehydrogenase, partial [bacterium]|nr:L-glutamate gamma-semialdehyde dehydrogenase [bacterium]
MGTCTVRQRRTGDDKDTINGLTGAFYSREPAHIELGTRSFHVGNLYINRKSTGALVGVHPFGG